MRNQLQEPVMNQSTTQMRAIVHDTYGSAEVLRLASIPRPGAADLADDEVLLRVHAAGLDRGTWHLMTGLPYLGRLAFGLRRPRNPVPGLDVAGTVVAVGGAVTRFAAGDEVFGVGKGTFAEYAVAREDKLARKPSRLGLEQAAVVPVSASTALQAVSDHGRLKPGQTVLVIGASGGVGSYAVQLAKALGAAEVTGVASTSKLDLVRSLGADRVIDYTREDFTGDAFIRGGGRYDVVFDLVGNRSLADCRRALTPSGTLVLSGGGVSGGGSLFGPIGLIARGRLVSRFIRHRVLTLTAVPSGENLATLRELVESGAVTPVIDRTFPLGDAAEAVRYLELEHARAKVVITV